MNEQTQKALLKFVALRLWLQRCFFGIFCAAAFRRLEMNRPLKRILVLRMGGLGDFIFSVPALSILRKRFPTARILLLTAISTDRSSVKLVSSYSGGPESLPWLEFVRPSIVDEALVLPGGGVTAAIAALRPRIASFDPDCSFVLSHPGETAMSLLKKIVFLRALGARGEVFGWRKTASYGFLRRIQDFAGRYEHKVLGPIRAVEECERVGQIEDSEIEFPLSLSAKAESWADSFWRTHQLESRRVVALSPGSIRPHKQWPLERYIELGNLMLRQADITLLVIGSGQDREIARRLQGQWPRMCVSAVGEADIARSAALLKRCCLMVGNDGGSVHLASAVRCPCVTLSNAVELSGAVEPWFSRDLTVRRSVPCSPCYSETHCPLGKHVCVLDLRVEDVYSACLRALRRSESAA